MTSSIRSLPVASMTKPTGYTVTVDAQVLWVLLRCYGSTCCTDRVSKYGHTKAEDHKVSKVWSQWSSQLDEDGYSKYTWENDND